MASVHNKTQNNSDNLPSYLQVTKHNENMSIVVYFCSVILNSISHVNP